MDHNTKIPFQSFVLIIVLFLLISIFRFLLVEREPVHHDEISTMLMIKLPLYEMVHHFKRGTKEYGQMPLSFILCRLSVVEFDRTLFWFRFPFFLIGIFGIIVMFFLAKSCFNDLRFVLLSLILISMNPAHIEQSHLARFYGLMFFAATGCYYCLFKFLKKPSIMWGAFLSFFILISLYNHYFGLIFSGLVFLNLLIFFLFPRLSGISRFDQTNWQKNMLLFSGIVIVIVVIGYSPWFTRFFEFMKYGTAEMSAAAPSTPGELQQVSKINMAPEELHLFDLRNPLSFGQTVLTYFSGNFFLTIPFFLLFCLGALSQSKCNPPLRLIQIVFWLGTFSICGIFLGSTQHMFHPRYVVFLLPLFFLGVINGLYRLTEIVDRLVNIIYSRMKLRDNSSTQQNNINHLFVMGVAIFLIIGQSWTLYRHFEAGVKKDNNEKQRLEFHLEKLDAFFSD